MWFTYTTTVIDAFSVWNAVGWLLLAGMTYGTWRLWRGMRPDAFERGLRGLREGRRARLAFPHQSTPPARRTGWLQVSLLPLMLISCGAAMLLAQAQRPDDVSRPLTWFLFVSIGTWYGTSAWRRLRGVGPLRNYALAGVLSGFGLSVLLWGFYLAVDGWWGEATVARVTASFPSLLWWTAAGSAVGGLVGAFRASRVYSGTRGEGEAVDTLRGEVADGELAIEAAPRARRLPWGAMAMACGASLLFHLSAAPHLCRKVDIRYWVWHWDNCHLPGDPLTLTMAPALRQSASPSFQVDFATADIGYGSLDSGDIEQVTDFVPRESLVASRLNRVESKSPTRQLVATPARRIAAGERIQNEMILLKWSDGPHSLWVSNARMIVGKVANQTLSPGQPIQMSQVNDDGLAQPIDIAGSGSNDETDMEIEKSVVLGSTIEERTFEERVDLFTAHRDVVTALVDFDLAPRLLVAGLNESVVQSPKVVLDGQLGVGPQTPESALLGDATVPLTTEGEPAPSQFPDVEDPKTTSYEGGDEPPSSDLAIATALPSVARPKLGAKPQALSPPSPPAIGFWLLVFTQQGKRYDGELLEWNPQSIVLGIEGDRATIARSSVESVVVASKSSLGAPATIRLHEPVDPEPTTPASPRTKAGPPQKQSEIVPESTSAPVETSQGAAETKPVPLPVPGVPIPQIKVKL